LGRRVYDTRSGQFIIVVEGLRGASGANVGNSLMPTGLDGRPDLQIQSTNSQGNGSVAVCDTGTPPFGGGIPGINPPRFDAGDAFVTNALLDFACRFEVFTRSAPCTIIDSTRQTGFIEPAATVQFCDIVAATAEFPPGETVLTTRLRDASGQVGPAAQIVVRVATPTPTGALP